jgi:hypothetical protein
MMERSKRMKRKKMKRKKSFKTKIQDAIAVRNWGILSKIAPGIQI